MCIALVHVEGTSNSNTISALFNREELFNRPTKRLYTWANCDIIGGQDSDMLGTWKALNTKLKRIVLLTNGRALNTLGTIGAAQSSCSTGSSGDEPSICSRGVLVKILASEPKPLSDAVQIAFSSSLYHSFNLIAIQFDMESYSFDVCKIVHRTPNATNASLITQNEVTLNRHSMAESLCLIMENMGISTFSLTCPSQSDFPSAKGYNLAKAYSMLWQRNEHKDIPKLIALLSQRIQGVKGEHQNMQISSAKTPIDTSADVDVGEILEQKLSATFIPPFMIPSGSFGTVSSSILLYSYPSDDGMFYEKKYNQHARLNEDKEIKISFHLCKKE
ncbi:hypothetical protein MDAP_002545 [Mitosporidium daphniae]